MEEKKEKKTLDEILKIQIDNAVIKKVLLYVAAFMLPFLMLVRNTCVFKSLSFWRWYIYSC